VNDAKKLGSHKKRRRRKNFQSFAGQVTSRRHKVPPSASTDVRPAFNATYDVTTAAGRQNFT
jgi:hypothetical protein